MTIAQRSQRLLTEHNSDGTHKLWDGYSITYGTAAPISGTWKRGDRRYNSTPTVGQAKSWVCTVAGTPGTWVSEGNL